MANCCFVISSCILRANLAIKQCLLCTLLKLYQRRQLNIRIKHFVKGLTISFIPNTRWLNTACCFQEGEFINCLSSTTELSNMFIIPKFIFCEKIVPFFYIEIMWVTFSSIFTCYVNDSLLWIMNFVLKSFKRNLSNFNI